MGHETNRGLITYMSIIVLFYSLKNPKSQKNHQNCSNPLILERKKEAYASLGSKKLQERMEIFSLGFWDRKK
jgi:hypothetical protein